MLLPCYGTYSSYKHDQEKMYFSNVTGDLVIQIALDWTFIIDQTSSVCRPNRESVSSVKLAVKLHLNKFVCRILMSTVIMDS